MKLEINKTKMNKQDKESLIESLNESIEGGNVTVDDLMDESNNEIQVLKKQAKIDWILSRIAFAVSIISLSVFIYIVVNK